MRPHEPSGPAWTAKRCQHLLRQIVVALAVLRRELAEAKGIRKQVFKTSAKPVTPAKGEGNVAPTPAQPSPPTAGKDPDWMPKPAKQKTKALRRYGGRKARTYGLTEQALDESYAVAGPISINTPYLTKLARGDPNLSPLLDTPLLYKPDRNYHPRFTANNPRKPTTAPDALHRLHRALHDLLTATSDRHPPPTTTTSSIPRGASSLLSMCLRRVPAVIEQEEENQQQSLPPEQRSDVASEVYAELEVLGYGLGWRHLREVVRAHGVAIVAAAVAEGLLGGAEGVGEVVESLLVVNAGDGVPALREAEDIWGAVVASEERAAGSFDVPATCPAFWRASSSLRFRLAEACLRRCPAVPPGETVSSRIWQEAVVAVAKGKPSAGFAHDFLLTAVRLAVGAPITASEAESNGKRKQDCTDTIASMVSFLASVAIAGLEGAVSMSSSPAGTRRCVWLLKSLALQTMAQVKATNNLPTKTTRIQATLILAAMLLVVLNTPTADRCSMTVDELVTCMRRLGDDIIRRVAKLVCSVGTLCSKIWSRPPLDPLKTLINGVVDYSARTPRSPRVTAQYLQHLGLATAAQYAADAENDDEEEAATFVAQLKSRIAAAAAATNTLSNRAAHASMPGAARPNARQLEPDSYDWACNSDELVAITPLQRQPTATTTTGWSTTVSSDTSLGCVSSVGLPTEPSTPATATSPARSDVEADELTTLTPSFASPLALRQIGKRKRADVRPHSHICESHHFRSSPRPSSPGADDASRPPPRKGRRQRLANRHRTGRLLAEISRETGSFCAAVCGGDKELRFEEDGSGMSGIVDIWGLEDELV